MLITGKLEKSIAFHNDDQPFATSIAERRVGEHRWPWRCGIQPRSSFCEDCVKDAVNEGRPTRQKVSCIQQIPLRSRSTRSIAFSPVARRLRVPLYAGE